MGKYKHKEKNSRYMGHWELSGKIRYRLTNDYMFRAVMQKNKNVLKHLICALLDLSADMVKDLVIQNPIELGKEIDSKTCILDIKVLLNDNQYINIEMQVSKQEYWKERSLTYLCRTYDNLEAGKEYNEVNPAIQISILDFNLFEEIEELCSRYYLMNENVEYHNRYTDGFAIYVLNLRQIYNEKVIQKEQQTELYQWAKLFRAESWEEIRMLAEKDEIFDECVCTMAQLTEDEKIRMQCEARNDYIARQKGLESRITEEVTKKITQQVTEEVTQQVTEEVTQQVTEEVTQKVTEEVTQKVTEEVTQKVTQQVTKDVSVEIARNLLDVLDISTISEKTGLSVEEIKQLKQHS